MSAWQDEQDAVGGILADRDGDHDGLDAHWDDRIPQEDVGRVVALLNDGMSLGGAILAVVEVDEASANGVARTNKPSVSL